MIARGETSAVRGEAGYGSGVLDFLADRAGAQGLNEREWRISGGLLTGRREDGRHCAFGKPYPRDTSSHRSIDGGGSRTARRRPQFVLARCQVCGCRTILAIARPAAWCRLPGCMGGAGGQRGLLTWRLTDIGNVMTDLERTTRRRPTLTRLSRSRSAAPTSLSSIGACPS